MLKAVAAKKESNFLFLLGQIGRGDSNPGPLPRRMVMLLLSDLTLGVNESVSSGLFDLRARLEQTWQAMTPASTMTSATTSLLIEGDFLNGSSPGKMPVGERSAGLLQSEMKALASASTITVAFFVGVNVGYKVEQSHFSFYPYFHSWRFSASEISQRSFRSIEILALQKLCSKRINKLFAMDDKLSV